MNMVTLNFLVQFLGIGFEIKLGQVFLDSGAKVRLGLHAFGAQFYKQGISGVCLGIVRSCSISIISSFCGA